jgi:hypothetical protein
MTVALIRRRGSRVLAQSVLVQDGGAAGSVRGVGWGGSEELSQVGQHDAAADYLSLES